MSNPRFDLVDIIRVIDRRKRFVFIVTGACLLIGLLFHFLREKKYEAKTAFFVSNPIYADRSSMFAGADSRYTDYFGDEDDIDRVIALSESDTIITQVIRNTGLDKAYDLSLADPYQRNKLKNKLKKNLDIKRTEYKLLELDYTDPNPNLAATVSNEAVRVIGQGYSQFYNSRKNSVYQSIKNRLHTIDSSINSLTDTLAVLREASGIYDIISPSRVNLVTGNVKGNGNNQGYYVEVIQNYEAIKDMLVIDRAKYLSLLNQYSTGVGEGEMPLLHTITLAKPPVDPAGPGLLIVLAASFFIGLFFSIFYLLISTYYKLVISSSN